MAFELPDHLPRGGVPQDRSTQILTKLGEATQQTLNASLVASWLAELDFTIRETKSRISRRIYDDLPAFERQLQASSSIQTRLIQLAVNVDRLVDSLDNTETGILPTLLQALTAHSTLASQAHDSETTHRSMAHLCRIKEGIQRLSTLMMNGDLPESATASVVVQNLITEAPSPLNRALIMSDIQKRHRALNDRLQEQLNDAYDRSIQLRCTVDGTTFTIISSTIAIPSSTTLTLSSILQSLSTDSLSSRLTSLRRDVISKVIEPVLSSSSSVAVSTSESLSELKLSLGSISPTPLKALQILNDFLSNHLFPHLPPSQHNFPSTFHVPITNAILSHLLQPNVSTSLAALPHFLDTVEAAVQFEEDLISSQSSNRPVRLWASDVAIHYGKKKREAFLQKARILVNSPEDELTFRVDIDITQPSLSSHTNLENDETSAWDFDEAPSEDQVTDSIVSPEPPLGEMPTSSPSGTLNEQQPEADESGDAWGWGDNDDDIEPSQEAEQTVETSEPDVNARNPLETPHNTEVKVEEQEEEPEDDPWDDDGSKPKLDIMLTPSPVTTHIPKTATRLEKFSAKAKGFSAPSTPIHSPAMPNMIQTPSPSQVKLSTLNSPVHAQAVTKQATTPTFKETKKAKKQERRQSYAVSGRAKKVLEIAVEALREGQDLLQSSIFANFPLGKATNPGQLLLTVAPAILDLHRALYPIAHSASLARDTNLVMRWSNDCTFLSNEITRLKHLNDTIDDKWTDTADRLKTLSEVSFQNAVDIEQETVRNILAAAEGFKNVSNSQRWQECTSVFSQVLQEITKISHQWKDTLTRDGYFRAVGLVVDEALFRIMDDIFSLQDIPEADSERLSDLCESLTPLEELFVYAPDEQSAAGMHVPLWFKFSYLSWLIKGSIADISYLFDRGVLVDYEIDELIRLLRALFAETPLRESTIAKFSQGHPATDNFDQ
ncbi:Centromere/kinetochore Zw10-domain-containing protein [Hysterangium stoloniferum]|nr:Centromere/kinetochore Zw10-domain-containing protein [Hysterangium stoloniferum]